MLKNSLVIFFLTVLLMSSATALACSAMGENKHVGMITAIDKNANTFTIMDAETRKPITFSANQMIIEAAGKASSQVIITFEDKDGKLVAADIGV